MLVFVTFHTLTLFNTLLDNQTLATKGTPTLVGGFFEISFEASSGTNGRG